MGVGGFVKKLAWTGATLASGMPGPVGVVAKAVGAIIGKDLDPSKPDEVTQAINGATPEQMIELQKFELAHAETMQAAGFKNALDMLQVDVEDRKDARARQVALKDTIFLPCLATFVVAAAVFIFWLVITGRATSKDAVIVGAVLGYIAGMGNQVVNFFFGSSAGSQAKDKMLLEANPPGKGA